MFGDGGPVAGAQMGVGADDGGRWGLSPTWGVRSESSVQGKGRWADKTALCAAVGCLKVSDEHYV